MKSYSRREHGPLKKGQVFLRRGMEDQPYWPGIVMEAERTKKYDEYNIINVGEIFGFEHECGSLYANEVIAVLTVQEFNMWVEKQGFKNDKIYFKGKLIGHDEL